MIGIHEAGARLHIKTVIFFFDRLKLSRSVDRDVPRSWFLSNFLVLVLQSVNSKSNSHVEIRTFLQDSCDIRKDSLLNLSVGHNVDRFELIVLIERFGNLRQILAGKRFTASKNQHTKVTPKCF